jgi:hypothetical protein
MAIQGVQGNIFELLLSPDKKIQDFISTLKQGDILKGRIIEIFPNEQKAIINFKGFNLVSQIPANLNLSKGDIINVSVVDIGKNIQMKIVPDLTEIGTGVVTQLETNNVVKAEQFVNLLNSLKVPVNEQNIYIAEKLINYGLPLTKENISEVSNKLLNYFESKGIDIRAINITNQSTAKEIVLTSIIKFAQELDGLFENLKANFSNNNNTNIIAENNMIPAKEIKSQIDKIMNLFNISKEISKATDNINFTASDKSITVEINNWQDIKDMKNVSDVVKNNENILNLKNLKGEIIINNNTLTFKLENIQETLNAIVNNLTKMDNINSRAVYNLNQMINNIADIGKEKIMQPFLNENTEQINILNENGKKLLNEIKQNFINLKQNILFTNQNDVQGVIKQSINTVILLKNMVNEVNKNMNNYVNKNYINKKEVMLIKQDFKTVIDEINKVIEKININENTEFSPLQIVNIHNDLKQLVNKLSELNIFKSQENFNTAFSPEIMNNIDIESTLEAIVFLKSRNIQTDNNFIDSMQRYFVNGMKLNQNIESLMLNIKEFENLVKNQAITGINKNDVDILNKIVQDIRDISDKMTIKPEQNKLDSESLLNQIKNFIDKSGINLESKIKQVIDKTMNIQKDEQPNKVEPNKNTLVNNEIKQLRENFKSLLIELNDKLDKLDYARYTDKSTEVLHKMKANVDDLLANLNALQFINQKPVSFDIFYTQLPVFINNRFFNGEIQIWYKKGSLKQNLEASEPLNIVFLLNTSNLGNIKINMLVHKSDVDCVIQTENEKIKQILLRNKNEFLSNIENINLKVKNFSIKVENEKDTINAIGNGYINLGKIDLKA